MKKIHLLGSPDYENFEQWIRNYNTDEGFAKSYDEYTTLQFDKNDVLVKVQLFEDDVEEEINNVELLNKFTYPKDFELNSTFHLIIHEDGHSFIGGAAPKNLDIPKIPEGNFHYMGCISSKDELFNWLPFDLHLLVPKFMNFDSYRLNYSNPLNPKIVDTDFFTDDDLEFVNNVEVEFEKKYFGAQTLNMGDTGTKFIGHSGVPIWMQINNVTFHNRFVCQLSPFENGFDNVKSKLFLPNKYESKRSYLENQFTYGDLYIFFDPKTNIVEYVHQYT